ncbi:MAG: hypothetical protein ACJ8KF_03605 [Chthoniobacterales bacterium]
MGWSYKKDTARRAYIELLREQVGGLDSLPPDRRESVLYAELIAADYLSGVTRRDQDGFPSGNIIQGITVKGRLFLQELEERERQRSSLDRAKKYGLIAFGFAMGIISHVLPGSYQDAPGS